MRKLMYLLLLNCCCFLAYSQPLNFGLKGGIGFSKINGKGMAKIFSEGYSVGVYAQTYLHKRWDLQFEMEYNPMDVKASTDFRTYYVASSRSSGYETMSRLYRFSLPLLISYSLSERVTLQFGPQYSYTTATKESLLKNNQTAFSKNDLALVAGGQLNTRNFFVSLRYQYGIKNVNAINDYYNWYCRQVQLGVGLRLFSNEK
jgi:hypothetical protein